MVRRVSFGALTIAIVLAIAALDAAIAQRAETLEGALYDLLSRGSIIPCVLTALFVMGAVELNHMLRLSGAHPHSFFAYLMVALLMLTPWLSAAGWLGAAPAEVEGIQWQVVCLMFAVIGSGVLTVLRARPSGALRNMSSTLLIIVVLGFLGSFSIHLRCGLDVPEQQGAWLLLITILVTKSSDIGAFLVGSTIGRHKLCPSVSPGKTVEGALGGVAGSAAVAVLFASASSLLSDVNSEGALPGVASAFSIFPDSLEFVTRTFGMASGPDSISPIARAMLFGVAMSIAGQFGDLIESCFKRDAGVKDSSNVIQPFGGILDLIDSLVPAMPVAWFLLTAVWNVV